jgi:hypothetical protein
LVISIRYIGRTDSYKKILLQFVYMVKNRKQRVNLFASTWQIPVSQGTILKQNVRNTK